MPSSTGKGLNGYIWTGTPLKHFKLPQGIICESELYSTLAVEASLWRQVKCENEETLVQALISIFIVELHINQMGGALSLGGGLAGKHSGGKWGALTFHEPGDSSFCKTQHSMINIMQQVMQRKAANTQDGVQSMKTCRRQLSVSSAGQHPHQYKKCALFILNEG